MVKMNLQYWVVIIVGGLAVIVATIQDVIEKIKHFRKRRLI
jgi:uncharacterized protein YlzI (FlbEa/FlbD family)